eukprot:6735957-Pyramimonas_sp.AAC.1
MYEVAAAVAHVSAGGCRMTMVALRGNPDKSTIDDCMFQPAPKMARCWPSRAPPASLRIFRVRFERPSESWKCPQAATTG